MARYFVIGEKNQCPVCFGFFTPKDNRFLLSSQLFPALNPSNHEPKFCSKACEEYHRQAIIAAQIQFAQEMAP
jgi:hypothetical protein